MRKIKTSKHFLNNLNLGKNSKLEYFIKEYSSAVNFYINYVWNNKISFKSKEEIKILDIKNDLLDCPMFISTVDLGFTTNLSARVLKSAATQALGLVSGAIEKRKRKFFIINKMREEGKRTRKLTKLLSKELLIKPSPNVICPNLDSLCSKVEKSNMKHFDSVLTLFSLGKVYGKIVIPFNQNKHSRHLECNGKLLAGIQISKYRLDLRWEINQKPQKTEGILVGADTGINSVVTLSDKQSGKICNHGHSLNSILKKIVRKKKGSRAFEKALSHRNNYINWSINQLNFDDIKEVRLEKINNFRKGKCVGSFLNYFGETLIRSKLLDTLSQLGVLVKEESSAYRSQRCSHCGFVYRGNRKEKLFSCKHCSFQADADYNASCNHEQNLPSATFLLYHPRKPRRFFWKEEGFYSLDGLELTVSDTKKDILYKV